MSEPASLDTVLITSELERRPSRAPDYRAESRALRALMKSLKKPGESVLQELAEAALHLCRAQSAGISIAEEEEGRPVFRWHASAGLWSAFLRNTIPRDASPCGTVLDRNTPLLVRHAERHFTYPVEGVPPLVETLLVPLEVDECTVGTVWVILHDESRQFEREDLRILRILGDFASTAFQVIEQQKRVSDALQRELTGTELLQSISSGVIAEGDVDNLYRQIVEAAAIIMGSPFASLQMVDRNGELKLLAWKGFHPQSARFWRRVRLDSPASRGEALRARSRYTVRDTEQSEQIAGSADLAEFRRSGIRAMQSTPLVTRSGKLIGAVSTHWPRPHAPSDSELRIFDVLARETADLIERTDNEAALRQANRRKDEFLAVLGHELRNPLAPLRTGIELLERAGHKPELVENIHSMMKRQVSHLTRLVDDLLDLSRITRGRIELRRAPLDLHVVIEAAAELCRPLVDQGGHELVLRQGEAPMPVDGDFERLTQVVANLLSNAAKFMDPGGRIELRSGVEAGHAVVRVRDFGYGIPVERLHEIFEMFAQVPEHRARRGGGGLGIGLALARKLVAMHGGSLRGTSEGPGSGSEFVVRLPLGTAAALPDAASRAATAEPPVPRRVLVVDDNVDAAASLRDALQLSGHSVVIAHDGSASLSTLESFAPDVLLLDIGLPGMDGYELARRIRAMPGGDRPLLVAITGWDQDADRERARRAGFDLHMTKPVRLEALETVLAGGRRRELN